MTTEEEKSTNDLIVKVIQDTEGLFNKKNELWRLQYPFQHKKLLGFFDFKWSDEVYMPLEKWIDIYDSKITKNLNTRYALINDQVKKNLIVQLATISAWRHSKGMYCLSDRVIDLIENKELAEIVSLKHVKEMTEWAIYIPIKTKIGDVESIGVFISKNTWGNKENNYEANCLILNFNKLNNDSKDLLPYIMLKADQNYEIENSVFDLYGFSGATPNEIIHAVKNIMGIFNICFDPLTKIESDVVGVKKPHYIDVEFNINFNDFNTPTFKYLAPSNLRQWIVGLNYLADLSRHERMNLSMPSKTLKWQNDGSELKLQNLLKNNVI